MHFGEFGRPLSGWFHGFVNWEGGCEFWSMKLASPSLEGVDVGGREYKGEELSSRTSFIGGWSSIGSCSSSQMEKRVSRSFSVLQLLMDSYINEIVIWTTL